ncbi:Rne/Rng family ribonuclease [bacterium]|nr:Rne/Rng family ribonuclease [bacterium]
MSESLMLINQTDDECRIAIVVDGLLQEMLIEHTTSSQIKNNIYKGVIVQVQTSLQAAFVDYGEKKHGFLPNNELNPSLYSKKGINKNKPIQHKVKVGQEIIVQVTREASDHKGSALTTNITLPGRFMVLMPNNEKGGISKKIESQEERDRLKGFLSGIESEEHAVIIRTAGIGRKLNELKKDYTTLKKTWNNIKEKFKKSDKPGLILEEDNAVIRTLRDYYTEDISEVWVDNPETFQNALQFFKQVAPRKQKDLKLFVGDRSLFATYNIERQVEQLTSNSVKLKSGGSIVINQTEALVAIDVNSGKSNQEGNIDSTALRTNLEAADEIARQLKLRNLGGLIVIDFIDMENESYRKQVEERLSQAMRMDKAQLRFNPISQFGLLEMSRQRLAASIANTVESTCPVCSGKGKIPSLLASTNLIIRSIREIAAKGNVKQIVGELPLELVNHLLNERRQSIYDLEMEFGINIVLRANPSLFVFQESQMKPVFDQKSPTPEPQPKPIPIPQLHSRKESNKTDPKNRRDRKHQQHRDTAPKKYQTEIIEEEVTEPDETDVDLAPEVMEEKPVTAPQIAPQPEKNQVEAKKSPPVSNQNSSYGIHPSALFSDIQELDEEELEEITESFGNRLKGKTDKNHSQLIDNKYLWKSVNGKSEKKTADEIKDDQPLKESEKTGSKTTPILEEEPEVKKDKPKRPTRRRQKRKPQHKDPATKVSDQGTKDPVPKETPEDKKESRSEASPAIKKTSNEKKDTSKKSSTSTKNKTDKKTAVKASPEDSKKEITESDKKTPLKSKKTATKTRPRKRPSAAKKPAAKKKEEE